MHKVARTSACMNVRTAWFMQPIKSKVVVQGLDGYIVAEKNGQLLVRSLKEEQRIK